MGNLQFHASVVHPSGVSPPSTAVEGSANVNNNVANMSNGKGNVRGSQTYINRS